MKLGTTAITDAKVGSTQLAKIYLGTILVWEKSDDTFLISEDWTSTTPSSDWTIKNDGTYTDNEWKIGSAVKYDGSYSMYITNDGGVSCEYDSTGTDGNFDIAHLCSKQLTIPSGKDTLNVQVRIMCKGEAADYDYGALYWVSSLLTVYAGSEISSLNRVGSKYLHGDNAWHEVDEDISVTAGDTGYLVWSFKCDYSVEQNPPLAVDHIRVSAS